jgi:uncharacterized metal-binding protein YceD (DUF177 family)
MIERKMSKNLTVYIDRLRSGEEADFDEKVSESTLDASDDELRFPEDAHVKGRAYLAEDHLVLTLDIDVAAEAPCSVCNEWTPVKFSLTNYYITKPLEEIRSNVYPFLQDVREGILLEVPGFVECEGNCPSREALKPFCGKGDEEETHFPFKDL